MSSSPRIIDSTPASAVTGLQRWGVRGAVTTDGVYCQKLMEDIELQERLAQAAAAPSVKAADDGD